MDTENMIDVAIRNLEQMSTALEKVANRKETYNSDYGYYLEQLSWDMYKTAQELKQRSYLFGGV